MNAEQFSIIAPTLPTGPGVYRYYSIENELLYVGKAKSLRKRISSYFTKNLTSYKTRELVSRIDRIEFTLVDSEQDAFLLENSLIKQFKPRFNIDLKDDKTYPYIVIKKEPFPRIFFTRRKIQDGSEYLGPFTSVGRVRELLTFIKQHIPMRTCKLDLSSKQIAKGKYKVCLEYHLRNCLGPCAGHQSEDQYRIGIERIRALLKGNLQPVIQDYRDQMQAHVEALTFEQAAVVKAKIDHLLAYQAKSTIINDQVGTIDVFSIIEEGDMAYVHYLGVHQGAIVHTQTFEIHKRLEENAADVLPVIIHQIRTTFQSEALEIVVPIPIEYPETNVEITLPKAGPRKKLLELALKNTNYFLEELLRRKRLHLGEKTEEERFDVLLRLQEDLQLAELPTHIECFDNSNFHGSYPVSAMVCFKDGMPSKNDYRRFNVKTVQGINDFATMAEVVHRRYKRLRDEQAPLPQLVIIDGGKGQLSSAMESIEALGLVGQMTVVGLAKNEEEIFFPGDSESIKLPWDSPSLKLMRSIRDEVHRFGITFHRQKRSKGALKNELESISGIGSQTVTQLLQTFKSVKNIRQQKPEVLEQIIGKRKTELLQTYFKNLAEPE